jgi:nicotinamidase-related amidase
MADLMGIGANIRKNLIDVNDSVLIVIDIQDSFLKKYEREVSSSIVERSVWLIRVGLALNVPVVATAEDIDQAGTLTQSLLDVIPADVKVHSKNSFNLADQPEILASVKATNRKTTILIGVETDVCVAQSTLGLIDNGYQVVVVKDAVATTNGDDEIGLSRIQGAGALISSVKAIHYEWLRTVKNTHDLYARKPELALDEPDDLHM